MTAPTLTFECPVESASGTLVLQPTGELDMAAVPRFEAAWTQAGTEAPVSVVLDLRGLDFMDSSGLHAIIALRAAVGPARLLSIIPGLPAVQRVFELTGLHDLLPFTAG